MSQHPTWLTTIVLPMPASYGSVNVHLIRTSHGVALIDTGLLETVSQNSLRAALSKQGLTLSDIDQVVLTHHHVDHTGLAALLQREGAEVYLSKEDAVLLQSFHAEPNLDEMRARCFASHPLPESMLTLTQKMFASMRRTGEGVEPNRHLGHQASLFLAGLRFQVVSTPGHTPGHICLYQPDERVLFTGDTLLAPQAIQIFGPAGDRDPLGEYLASLETLSGMSVRTAYPGHGRPIVHVEQKISEIKGALQEVLGVVANQLSDEPKTAFTLTSSIQTDERDRTLTRWLAFAKTVVLLQHMLAADQVSTIEGAHGVMYRRARSYKSTACLQ